jgi:hypothetical protein
LLQIDHLDLQQIELLFVAQIANLLLQAHAFLLGDFEEVAAFLGSD